MSDFDDLMDEAGDELLTQFDTTATATLGGSPVTFTCGMAGERGERETEQAAGGQGGRYTLDIIYRASDAALTPRTIVTIDGRSYNVAAIERLGGTMRKAMLERTALRERTRPGYRR